VLCHQQRLRNSPRNERERFKGAVPRRSGTAIVRRWTRSSLTAASKLALSDAFGRFQNNRILPIPFAFARWGLPCHFKRSGSDKIQCWDRLYEHEIRVSQRTPPESGVVSARQRKILLPSMVRKAHFEAVWPYLTVPARPNPPLRGWFHCNHP